MNPEAKKENILIRLKNVLKQNDVKLWLPPYHDENSNSDEKISAKCFLDLANKFSGLLNIETEECLTLLVDLQEQSLQRLDERNIFKSEGLAFLRIKMSGQRRAEFSVQLKLSDTTDDLKEKISAEVGVPIHKLKLICNGKVLKDGFVLESQNVKHGNTVLALLLQINVDEDILAETNDNHRLLEQTKQDLEYLSRGQKTNKYFSITNQIGSSLDIPSVDRDILVSAMTLHEKGRSALNQSQYQLALVFFFEADAEYKKCRLDILDRVDNYGLLNLDIVWTYLHLHSLQYLSDCEARLKVCEDSFNRCYGENFERLTEIKGTSGNERVLFMRLHLLQGIIQLCKNNRDQALSIFEQVEKEIENLKVDIENIKLLCELVHCSPKTAKLALQATYNHLDGAVNFVLRRREEKKIVREHERIRRFVDQHKCLNGEQINMTVLKQMNDMGYTNLISTYALVDSNNDINLGLLWIDNLRKKLENIYPAYVIDVFMTLEFDAENVKDMLHQFSYKLTDQCIEALIRKTAIGREYFLKVSSQSGLLNSPNQPSSNVLSLDSHAVPSTSSGITSAVFTENNVDHEEYDALGRLQNGILNSADAYLDSDLDVEENLLKLYKSFLLQ